MFSLKEVFFQPLKCQPNINTLHVYRNPTTGNQQIFLVGLDGFGMIVEYLQKTNEFKAYPISQQDFQSKSIRAEAVETAFSSSRLSRTEHGDSSDDEAQQLAGHHLRVHEKHGSTGEYFSVLSAHVSTSM